MTKLFVYMLCRTVTLQKLFMQYKFSVMSAYEFPLPDPWYKPAIRGVNNDLPKNKTLDIYESAIITGEGKDKPRCFRPNPDYRYV